MMKKIAIIILLNILPLGEAWWSFAQSVEAKLDSMAIFVGEQTGMTITVHAPKGKMVQWPSLKPRTYITNGVEIVDVEKNDTSDKGDELVITKKLLLTSFDEFAYKIPEQKLKIGGKVYQTNPLALKVMTLDVDTLHKDKYFPPKDVQDNPFLWAEWMPVVWMMLLILVLSAIGAYLYRRLKQNKPLNLSFKTIRHIPAHQKALNAIDKIKSDRLQAQEDQKQYYTRLTDALRKYIEERFGFSAMEMTSDEIISKLRETGDPQMISELRELFRTADMVKFAKYTTLINENDQNLLNAVHFIDETKQAEDVEKVEKVAPTISEQDKRLEQSRKIIKTLLYLIGVGGTLAFAYAIYTIVTLI